MKIVDMAGEGRICREEEEEVEKLLDNSMGEWEYHQIKHIIEDALFKLCMGASRVETKSKSHSIDAFRTPTDIVIYLTKEEL